jgi:hypothetical protein
MEQRYQTSNSKTQTTNNNNNTNIDRRPYSTSNNPGIGFLRLSSVGCHRLSLTISNIMGRDGEIVGLASGESGRACESHEIWWHHVAVRDLIKFKVVLLEEEGVLETKIKAVKIRDGTESCHIGFLPQHIVYGGQKEQMTNKFGQLLELYKYTNDMANKRKNSRRCGVAYFHLLDDIQHME